MPKLIVLSGIDGSGKYTQSILLLNKLHSYGLKAVQISFPIYNSASGHIIKQYLNGDFGHHNTIDPKIVATWYAFNRYEAKELLLNHLSNGITVICDRYVESNLAHQGCKIRGEGDRRAFFEWCHHLEYDVFRIPKPDTTVFLHVPSAISPQLMGDRASLDVHESDGEHLAAAEQVYLGLSELYGWHKIDCAAGGAMKAPEDIAKSIDDYLNSL